MFDPSELGMVVVAYLSIDPFGDLDAEVMPVHKRVVRVVIGDPFYGVPSMWKEAMQIR